MVLIEALTCQGLGGQIWQGLRVCRERVKFGFERLQSHGLFTVVHSRRLLLDQVPYVGVEGDAACLGPGRSTGGHGGG
jgi:hypothetical protein